MNSAQRRQFSKIYTGIFKNLKNKKWECMESSCKCKAINSHLLQQNGILNNIAEDNHLIEFKPADSFAWNEDQLPMNFRSVGIKQALSLDLFCNIHDSVIFKKLETAPVDFTDYENQLLLSYRAVCAELRKKEYNVETFTRLLNSKSLQGSIPINIFEFYIKTAGLAIKDLEIYKKEFENEIGLKKDGFAFTVIKYPLIKICCSSSFSPYETISAFNESLASKYVFFHVIPDNQELYIIIGYQKKQLGKYILDYIDSWQNLTVQELGCRLTDVFAKKIENWGLSPEVYRNINPRVSSNFIKFWREYPGMHPNNQDSKLNLFEYYNGSI